MELQETAIEGCYQLGLRVHRDERGSFVKTFQATQFARRGLPTEYREEFFSVSKRGVIRGLHFQVPPHEQNKIVTCVSGEVLDAVVDLRLGSRSYRRWATIPLSADAGSAIYIPAGCAHGFLVKSEVAIVCYQVTSEYSALHDLGVRWNSAGIDWGVDTPIVSDRDAGFPALCEFQSPFLG